MQGLTFHNSDQSTLGVEVELALVDAQSMALRSSVSKILERVPKRFANAIKPELMQCYVEVNTDICNTVNDVEQDLREKIIWLEGCAEEENLRLYWSGTHPFSRWKEQQVTDNDRYQNLINMLQDTARQLITFGLHVHVGVDSGDKAVMICDRMLRYLPLLLSASSNSPFWEGRVTGLHSWRSKVMDGLPTAGLPPLMRNWSEYVWLIKHLIETGYIESIREIWWDVRPHHNFGTVEVRICDIPGSLHDTLGLVALVQCLVKALSDEIDRGTYQHDCHPMMIRQNKWRAARFGLEADLVDSNTYETIPARDSIKRLVNKLRSTAQQLDCDSYLERMIDIAEHPGWAARQLEILEKTDDPAEVVRQMTEFSRLR